MHSSLASYLVSPLIYPIPRTHSGEKHLRELALSEQQERKEKLVYHRAMLLRASSCLLSNELAHTESIMRRNFLARFQLQTATKKRVSFCVYTFIFFCVVCLNRESRFVRISDTIIQADRTLGDLCASIEFEIERCD
jgi:hypothetical protein